MSGQSDQGRRLGNYVLLEPIGQGGMGTVYRARHTTLDVEVALKLLSPRFSDDAAFLARFRREAQAAAALSHPSIVRVTDAGEIEGTHFLAMEFVEGRTLSEILREEGPLDVTRALDTMIEVAGALAHAHGKGFVHRDITPGNIMVTDDGCVKLADMGLAKQVGSQLATGATETGATVGTPYYMSPEQVVDSGRVDQRSDIYSLGATLYNLLSGKRPFDGVSAYDIMRQVETAEPVPLRRLVRGISPNVSRLVQRMMAKDPDDRYQTAEELLADLERTRAGMSIARFRRGTGSFRPAGHAREYWKTAVVAGVSAGAVVAAVLAGFLLAGRPSETLPDAIAILPAPSLAEPADGPAPAPEPPPPWPMVLPSAPVEVEEQPGAFVLTAGDSRVTASERALDVSLAGTPVIADDLCIPVTPDSFVVEASTKVSLTESSAGAWLDARRTVSRNEVRDAVTRTLRFSESEVLIDWTGPARLGPIIGSSTLWVGVLLDNELITNRPTRIDEARGPSMALLDRMTTSPDGLEIDALAFFLPDRTINVVTQAPPHTHFILCRSNEGPTTWRLQTALLGRTKSADKEARTRARLLITSIPVIRHDAYAATLANGQLTLAVDGKPLLAADGFEEPGFNASRVIPTGYYRDERDEARGYRFATPVDRPSQESPLVKSFLFRERSIQLAWRWQAGPESQRSFLLEADTVMGCPYAAKTADGETHTGTLTRKTMLSGLQVLVVDLGRRRMTFKPDAPDYAFDGERCLIVETDKGDGPGLRTGRVVIEFSSADADD